MRNSSASVLALAVVSLLVACGGSDDDAGGSETSLPAVIATDATSTSTSTTTSTTSTTSTPPTTVPSEPECLEGSWWLSPDETTSLYAALLPGMPVTVTGTHWAEFGDGAVDYWAILEVRFAVGGADVTFGVDQHGVGSYTVAHDVLTMSYDTFESNVHEGHGTAISNPDQHPETYVDDAVDLADNGDGTITINRITVPMIEIPPVAGGPMGCEGDTMSLGFTSGLADTSAVFVRMS